MVAEVLLQAEHERGGVLRRRVGRLERGRYAFCGERGRSG